MESNILDKESISSTEIKFENNIQSLSGGSNEILGRLMRSAE